MDYYLEHLRGSPLHEPPRLLLLHLLQVHHHEAQRKASVDGDFLLTLHAGHLIKDHLLCLLLLHAANGLENDADILDICHCVHLCRSLPLPESKQTHSRPDCAEQGDVGRIGEGREEDHLPPTPRAVLVWHADLVGGRALSRQINRLGPRRLRLLLPPWSPTPRCQYDPASPAEWLHPLNARGHTATREEFPGQHPSLLFNKLHPSHGPLLYNLRHRQASEQDEHAAVGPMVLSKQLKHGDLQQYVLLSR